MEHGQQWRLNILLEVYTIYCIFAMSWTVDFERDFFEEAQGFPLEVRTELSVKIELLKEFGPVLGRPHADALKGSKYANMKELRFRADHGVWRVAFAFDPKRSAILLIGGDKRGKDQKQFYKRLIEQADKRYANHLDNLNKK